MIAVGTPIVLYAIKDDQSGWRVTVPEMLSWVWLVAFFPQWLSLLVVSCLPQAGPGGNLAIAWLSCVPASWIYSLTVERVLARRAAK